MARVKIGDVIEIKTKKGLVYAHYTHKHGVYGPLLRVFNSPTQTRPQDLKAIVSATPSFMCFFPLGSAINRGIFSVVGNVAPQSQEFPIFRTGVADRSSGRVAKWWLWDGLKEWQIGELTSEQRNLSIRGVWNDTLLLGRINSQWTPETDTT